VYELDYYIGLAKELELGEPVDWTGLPIDQDITFRLVGMSILSLNLDEELKMAAVIKLAVDNLVLNMQLLEKNS
jgi:hypothetical protein